MRVTTFVIYFATFLVAGKFFLYYHLGRPFGKEVGNEKHNDRLRRSPPLVHPGYEFFV